MLLSSNEPLAFCRKSTLKGPEWHIMATTTAPQRPKAADILAHSSYPDAVWKLKPSQSGKLSVAKGRGGPIGIEYEVHGRGEKKVILIVGLGGVSWAYQRQSLYFGHKKGDEYSSLVFDNRGIGKSDKPLMRYSTSEMARDVIELIDHLGWVKERELNIVGVSMGGMIAQELALLIPNRISSLSLFSTAAAIENTTTFFENFRTRLQLFVPKTIDQSLVDASKTMFPDHYLDSPDTTVVPDLSTPDVEFPKTAEGGEREYKHFATHYERWAAQELTKKLDPEAFGKKGFIMQAIAAGWHHKSAEQLKKLGDEVGRERIAVLHGDMDRMITVYHGKKLIEMLQPSESVIKEKTGHVFFMEHTKWHDEFLERRFRIGEELNRKAGL